MRCPTLLMLCTLASASISVSACGDGDVGPELVDGFHGYSWGSAPSEIREVARTGRGVTDTGLIVHSTEVSFLGRNALAGFYFEPRGGGLVEGQYVVPLSLEECEQEWERYATHIREAFPGLAAEERVPRREGADLQRYESDCEYYAYNSETEDWFLKSVNPERPHDQASMWIRVVGRSLRLNVLYRGGAGQAWDRRNNREMADPKPPPPPSPPDQVEEVPFGRG